jgi:alkylated DNA repair dioxygenase AlkB
MFADLFGAPVLPGLATAEDFISTEEERLLIAAIDAAPLAPFRFQGWTGKRLTHSYGWTYDFDRARFAESEPIPDWLAPLQAHAAAFAGLAPGNLAHVLLIRYDPGAGIGWHRDRPVFEQVVGVSLGAEATMRFRRRNGGGFERRSLPLPPRAAYHLAGEARHGWEHSIAPIEAVRWSVTFRSLRR